MTGTAVDPEESRPSARARIMLLALVFGAAGLSLIAAEAALRAFGPRETSYQVSRPNQRRVMSPDTAFLPGMHGDAVITTNELGLRGDPLPADSSVFRVLVVGGSTSENLYHDDSETWPRQLQDRMTPLADGRRVWVAAAARSGMNARDHVVQVGRLLPQLPRIDLMLVLVGVNDLTFALGQGDAYAPPPPLSDPRALKAQEARAFMVVPGGLHQSTTLAQRGAWYKRTALYQLGARIRANIVARRQQSTLVQDTRGEAIERWRENRRQASEIREELPTLDAPLAEYRRNLEAVADAAAARGVPLVLLTQPALWRAGLDSASSRLLWLGGIGDFQRAPGSVYYSPGALARAMAAHNAVLLDVCAARGLRCFDLAAAVPSDTLHFYDDVHFTERGARVIAEALATWLREPTP